MAPVTSHQAPSLMVVEDDETARDALLRLLSLSFPQSKIYAASNGKEGLELFKEHTPDIVITDINMPVMNGFEMVREIKSLNTSASYIMLTARNDKDITNKYQEIGFCARLLKPLNLNDFFEAIEKCSGGRLLMAR